MPLSGLLGLVAYLQPAIQCQAVLLRTRCMQGCCTDAELGIPGLQLAQVRLQGPLSQQSALVRGQGGLCAKPLTLPRMMPLAASHWLTKGALRGASRSAKAGVAQVVKYLQSTPIGHGA